jgi:hypothetical protein
MSEPAETLDCHSRARDDILLPQRVEDSDSRTKQRAECNRVDILRDLHHRFCSKSHIFSISSIPRYSVDLLIVTHLEQPTLAGFAGPIMTTMPRRTNSISHLPTLLRVRNGGDLAYHFMSRHNREAITEYALLNGRIGVADTASQHLDQDLCNENINRRSFRSCSEQTYFSRLRQFKLDLLESKRGAFGLEEAGLVFFWEFWCHIEMCEDLGVSAKW